MSYGRGALPSPPDARDYPVARFSPAGAPSLPAEWSFEGLLQPVLDQGAEGTCVGHAVVTVMGYQQITGIGDAEPDGEVLSRRDAYQGARMLEPVPGEGAYPRAAWKYAQQQGICLERTWPYRPHQPGQPGPDAPTERARNRVATYSRTDGTVGDLLKAMYWHGPSLLVVPIDEGFTRAGTDGRIVSAGLFLGYHAITVCGWSEARRAFRIRNSWGEAWGDKGGAWLPYSWGQVEAWFATPAPETPPPEKPWWERVAPWWSW